MTPSIDFIKYFESYQKIVLQIESDLRFWKDFLSLSIRNYKADNPQNREISGTIFSLYNIHPDGQKTWLHISRNSTSIEIKDLENHADDFFIWIMNLAMIRIYNAGELFLLQSIQVKYFPGLQPINNNRKNANKIIAGVKNDLSLNGGNFDTTNNRYLIEYLKTKSLDYTEFLKLKINQDWSTSWQSFYEFFSILRNIITHHAMVITPDIRNSINPIAKEAFKYYFKEARNTRQIEILTPRDEPTFLYLISHVNDFITNTVKFIAGENNFLFLGLRAV